MKEKINARTHGKADARGHLRGLRPRVVPLDACASKVEGRTGEGPKGLVTSSAELVHGESGRLGKLNNGETGSDCALGKALIGRDKSASRRPVLAPREGRRELQAISGPQLIGIE